MGDLKRELLQVEPPFVAVSCDKQPPQVKYHPPPALIFSYVCSNIFLISLCFLSARRENLKETYTYKNTFAFA